MSDLNEILKQPTKPKRNLGKLRRILMALGSVLLVIAAGGAIAFVVIKQNPDIIGVSKSEERLPQSPQEELNQTIEAVGKLILLPNELPTLATVTDLNELEGQEFFVNAQVGDRVLIYTNAKKAILYRPSEDKIIEVGAVTVEDVSEQEVAGETNTPGVKDLDTLSPTPEAEDEITPGVNSEPTLTPTITTESTATP